MIAGTRRIGRAPVGTYVPRVRRAAASFGKRPRRLETSRTASCTNANAEPDLQTISTDDARARADGSEELRVEEPKSRKDARDEHGFRKAIQRYAVKRSA